DEYSYQKSKKIYLCALVPYPRHRATRGIHHRVDGGGGGGGGDLEYLFIITWFAAAIYVFCVWCEWCENSTMRFCWTSRICGICFFIFIILSIIVKTMAWWSIFISLGLWILFAILHENAKEKEQKKE
ncbi:MAG: hypothetical protein J6S98_01315, partial [Lentisphaeria bacterium]|nr:hypothetical protein [Lentisphaeria bacterium]